MMGPSNAIYDSEDGFEFDDAIISSVKAKSYNKPRAKKPILGRTQRKRVTENNLESAARGMSRVGNRKNFEAAESLPLQNTTLGAFPPQKKNPPLDKRDKPEDRNKKR